VLHCYTNHINILWHRKGIHMLRFRTLMIALALLALASFGLFQIPKVIVQAGGFTVTPSSTASADGTPSPESAAEPSLLVAPSTGPAGTLHLIYGENLTPNTDYQIRIYLEGEDEPIFEADVTSSTRGEISLNYQTDVQHTGGRYGVELSDGNTVIASAMFQVTTVQMTAEPTLLSSTATETTPAPEGTPFGEAVGVINVEPPAGVIGTNHAIMVENLTAGLDYLLVVEFDGQQVYDVTLTADDNGTVGTFVYSEPADPVGEYTLRLFDPEGVEIATGLLTIQPEGDTPVAPPETPVGEATEVPETTEEASEETTSTPASPNQESASGQRFEGELDSETASASFEFDGTAGQVVSIRMISPDFDAYLLLADADDNILNRNDNSGGDFNAEINGYTLPADGRYTIIATSRQNLEEGGRAIASGSFVVTLNFAREADGGAIASGETVIGEVSEGANGPAYTFTGDAGQRVTIDLASDAFDPFVILFGPNGQQIISDDDSGPSLYARIDSFELLESGEYTIEVDGFRGPTGQREISGAYTLTLTFVDGEAEVFQPTGTPEDATAEPTTPPDATPEGETGDAPAVTYGQTFEGELTTDAQTAEVQFEGGAGDVLDITLDSDDFDPNITVVAPSGEEIASDDDSGPGVNSLITGLELPEDGTYTVVIDGYRGASGDREISGAYTLTLTSADGSTGPAATSTPSEGEAPSGDASATPGDTIPSTDLGIVTVDEPVSGTLNNAVQSAQYSFEAAAGDVVTIDLTSADFDPFVRLLDANGSVVAEDDDSGGSSQARIEGYVIPADGEYTIEVDAFRGFDGTQMVFGDYTVSLEIEEGTGVPAATTTPTAPAVEATPTGTPTPFDTPVSTDAPDLSATPEMSVTSTLVPDMPGTVTATPTPPDMPMATPTPLPDYQGDAPYYDYWPSPPVNPFMLTATPLTANQPTAITFTGEENEAYAFTFQGQAGQTLSLFTVYGDRPIDTSMTIYGPDGYPVAGDDDSGSNFNPEVAWLPLWQDGEYRVVVFPYIQRTSGTLQIYYNLFEAGTITPDGDPVQVLLADKIPSIPYTFEGIAGQQMRLTVTGEVPNTYSSPYVSVLQNGNVVMSSSVYGSVGYTVDFVIPADGEVTITFVYQGTGGMILSVGLDTVE
jgi:hypothetical protein